MNSEDSVRAVEIQASDAAVKGVIANLVEPPGRTPKASDAALSAWYATLDANDKARIRAVARQAAEMAVFELLCVIEKRTVQADPF